MGEDTYHLGIKALITDTQGKILLLKVNPDELERTGKSESNYWDLPGGRVQRGSTVVETLEREVEEELGVRGIAVKKSIGIVISNIRIPLSDGSDIGLVLSIYECKLPPNVDFRLSAEHLAYDWFSPQEAAKRLMIKYPKEFCELIARKSSLI